MKELGKWGIKIKKGKQSKKEVNRMNVQNAVSFQD